jgi:integrase
MSINRVKDRQGRARLEFEFDRRINGQRIRIRRSLPLGWTRAQADAYDRAESGRLYAIATGTEKPQHLIEEAVARYFVERIPELKHGASQAREMDLMEPWFRGKPLEQLGAACAAYLKDHRAALAPATIKNRLRYLVSACRWGWKHHAMCERDPGAGVVFPAVSNERDVWIDRAQMVMLAKACGDRRVRAMIRIAFYSGMRQGEIRAASVEGGYFVLPDSKNGDRVRQPIHPKIRCCTGYEWPSRYIVGYWFRKARAEVSLDHVHFHDERHSTATELLRQGADLHTVGAVLRHKSTASTKRYAHYATELVEAAVGKIGKKTA